MLDERIVDGLDVYAGGFTANYGDRMSAIIDARSLRPDADAYYELGLSLMHANALASHRFADGRGQWLASIRRSNLGEVADIMDSDLGEPKYIDGFARVDYEWSPATRGSLHTLLANDHAEITNSADTEHAVADYSNAYVWGTLTHDWSDQLSATAIVSFTDVAAERKADVFEPGKRIGTVDDERDYDVLGFKLDASYATDRWLQRAGIDVRTLSATYDYTGSVDFASDYPFPGAPAQDISRELAPEPSGEHFAVYYTVRGRLTDALTAEFGLRWDEETYGVDSDNQLAPRLNLAWRLHEARDCSRARAASSSSRASRNCRSRTASPSSRPRSAPTTSSSGSSTTSPPAYTLRVEAYRKNYGDLRTRYESLYDPLSLAPELRWDRTAISPSSAVAEGVELLLTRKPVDAWSGWFSYAWSRVDDRVDGSEVRRSWDQTHTAQPRRAVVVGTVAGHARRAVPHGLARHADRARCRGQRGAWVRATGRATPTTAPSTRGSATNGPAARHVDRAWRGDQRARPAQSVLHRHRVRSGRRHADARARAAALAAARALGRRALEVLEPQPTPCLLEPREARGPARRRAFGIDSSADSRPGSHGPPRGTP